MPTRRKKGPKQDAKGRFVSSANTVSGRRPKASRDVRRKARKPRDAKGRFVSKKVVRTEYAREVEGLRRELEKLKREGKAREKDIARNYKRRGRAYDQYVDSLALGQRVKIDKYLDDVYDGEISREDFVTMAVAVGLTVREAWAVLYS